MLLKTTRNLLANQKQFNGFAEEKSLNFLLEKVLRLVVTEGPPILTIETVFLCAEKLHKIEVKVPFKDWMFFMGPYQGFEVFSLENMRLLFKKQLILKGITKHFLKNMGFKDCLERNSLISVLKMHIEESQPITLAIESQEGGFVIWILNGERIEEEGEEFIKLWIEQEFFKGFLERTLVRG